MENYVVAGRETAMTSPCVYFVQAEQLRLIKIGMAGSLRSRLDNLQVGSPDRLALIGVIRTQDAVALEARLHAQFQKHRHHGEWFDPAPALLAFIAEHPIQKAHAESQAELRAVLESIPRTAA